MKFALIGHPVAGSLSPRLVAAAYDGRHTYDLLDFEHFEDAWKAFTEGYDGINVTAPFKQDAFARVDVLSPQARATGAVNLVTRSPRGFVGYNTDVDGVLMALRETGLSFADALVVGTGGAARAAVHAAQLLGCNVTVTGRSLEKAAALGCPAVPLPEAGTLRPDVILYTLPGRVPVPEGLPLEDAVVLEAEYRIPQLADIPCRQYVSGRRWMLGQAYAGYSLFTGEEPSLEKMSKVL
ncbi:MAG: hypothetical protein IKI85_06905 [Bacteroidales bacterium]|nr:hypothetical protein [Bacteroidales bacterium]